MQGAMQNRVGLFAQMLRKTFIGMLYIWITNIFLSVTGRNEQYANALSIDNKTDK